MFFRLKKVVNKIIEYPYLEVVLWVGALFFLTTVNPYECEHFSFCIFSHIGDLIGYQFCPGCGTGRAIALLYRGEISASFEMHPLGIPVLMMIIVRIITVLYKVRKNKVNGGKPWQVH